MRHLRMLPILAVAAATYCLGNMLCAFLVWALTDDSVGAALQPLSWGGVGLRDPEWYACTGAALALWAAIDRAWSRRRAATPERNLAPRG